MEQFLTSFPKIKNYMKFKVSSGLNIAASTWGLESDPLVVLLHGGGQTRHAWGETGKKLSLSGFHVLAIDLLSLIHI